MTRSFLVVLFALACLGAGCSGAPVNDGHGSVTDGDPEIERIQDGVPTKIPPHVLICGLYKNLSEGDLRVKTYLQDDGLSLYDFTHSDAQMATWMQHFPGGKAYEVRNRVKAGQTAKPIGRSISEPCFGNGGDAVDVIRQVVFVRAGGADASDALHQLLHEERTVHFVVDREGGVFQPLDPVHAAVTPEDNANFAIYVALVAPRRLHEWVPDVVAKGGARGLLGALASPTGDESSVTAIAAPQDHFAKRSACEVHGKKVTSEDYTDEQLASAKRLIEILRTEYPEIAMDAPIGKDGSSLRSVLSDSAYHKGVLADFHIAEDRVEPACLDVATLLSR